MDEKLEVTNEVMSGLLHEIRNPLCFLSSAHQLAHVRLQNLRSVLSNSISKPALDQFDRALRDLDLAGTQAHRLEDTLKKFNHQISYFEQQANYIDLAELLHRLGHEVNDLLALEGQETLHFDYQLDSWLPLLYVEGAIFQKVLMHLLLNISHRVCLQIEEGKRAEQVLHMRVFFEKRKIKILLCHGFGHGGCEFSKLPVMVAMQRWRPLGLGVALSWSLRMIEDRYGGMISLSDPDGQKLCFLLELPFERLSGCREGAQSTGWPQSRENYPSN